MPRQFELSDLRAFVAVAQEGSIRKAAERLHLSQPPLSRRIQALERLVGVALLTRTPAGVALTAEGERLMAGAAKLLEQADALLEHARPSGNRRLRAGLSLGLPVEWEKSVRAAWQRVLPGSAIETRADYTPRLARMLRDGALDVALLSLPGDTAGLETVVLASQPMVVALPKSHPAARRRQVVLAELKGLPLFWHPRSANAHFHDWCARAFREQGYTPRYHTVEPGFPLTLEHIGAGEGFTFLNGWRTRARVPGVAYRPLADGQRLTIQVAAAWKGGHADALSARLVAAARRALRGASG